MTSADYLIDFKGRKPAFTAFLVLPLPLLQLLTPHLLQEIMNGQVDTCGEDRVALHLRLSEEKKSLVQNLVSRWESALAGRAA